MNIMSTARDADIDLHETRSVEGDYNKSGVRSKILQNWSTNWQKASPLSPTAPPSNHSNHHINNKNKPKVNETKVQSNESKNKGFVVKLVSARDKLLHNNDNYYYINGELIADETKCIQMQLNVEEKMSASNEFQTENMQTSSDHLSTMQVAMNDKNYLESQMDRIHFSEAKNHEEDSVDKESNKRKCDAIDAENEGKEINVCNTVMVEASLKPNEEGSQSKHNENYVKNKVRNKSNDNDDNDKYSKVTPLKRPVKKSNESPSPCTKLKIKLNYHLNKDDKNVNTKDSNDNLKYKKLNVNLIKMSKSEILERLNNGKSALQKKALIAVRKSLELQSKKQLNTKNCAKMSQSKDANKSFKISKNYKKTCSVPGTDVSSYQESFVLFCEESSYKENQPFVQNKACTQFSNSISYCIECKESAEDKPMDQHTCRFYQYRTLIKKDGSFRVEGFAQQADVNINEYTNEYANEYTNIWLPTSKPKNLCPKTAKLLLTYVGSQFCKLFEQEFDIIKDNKKVTWKMPVKGVRELCDVCQTTIFNTHWVCPKCGFAVCIDCMDSRKSNNCVAFNFMKKNQDEFQWLLCDSREKHALDEFHLAIFITEEIYKTLNASLHSLRNQKRIMGTVCCDHLQSGLDIDFSKFVSNASKSREQYANVPQQWFCDGRLLVFTDPKCADNINLFSHHWLHGDPVMVQHVDKSLNPDLWSPSAFNRDFGRQMSRLVNCMNDNIIPRKPMKYFWDGFEDVSQRLVDQDTGEEMLLKLKDWPPNAEFREMLPRRFDDLMASLPLPEYTKHNGMRNLATRLPDFFVRPDLGPKMYCAYGSVLHPEKGTTNLHLDMSDAINVMIYVGIAKNGRQTIEECQQGAMDAVIDAGCDDLMIKRVQESDAKVGALWHIYSARDANKIRHFLTKIAAERDMKIHTNNDPIHDQCWYLDAVLRQRLYDEYKVKGFAIAQCLGDAILIPAGAPHQVRNLHSCIKVAGEFVSPENVAHCLTLTQEFRKLSKNHNNHEDKLQIKNIIYHTVKDSVTLLSLHNNDSMDVINDDKLSDCQKTFHNNIVSPSMPTKESLFEGIKDYNP